MSGGKPVSDVNNVDEEEQAYLKKSYDHMLQKYSERYEKSNYTKGQLHFKPFGTHNTYKKSPKTTKYSDAQVRGFRSAVEALKRLRLFGYIPIADVAEHHDIARSYANTLSNDYSIRSNAVPREELILVYMEEYSAASIAYKTMKRENQGKDPITMKTKQTIKNKMDWKDLNKQLHRCYGKYPQDVVEGIVMIENLLVEDRITIKILQFAIELLYKNLPPFKRLPDYVDVGDHETKDSMKKQYQRIGIVNNKPLRLSNAK